MTGPSPEACSVNAGIAQNAPVPTEEMRDHLPMCRQTMFLRLTGADEGRRRRERPTSLAVISPPARRGRTSVLSWRVDGGIQELG